MGKTDAKVRGALVILLGGRFTLMCDLFSLIGEGEHGLFLLFSAFFLKKLQSGCASENSVERVR